MIPVSSLHRSDVNASSNAQDNLEKRRRQIEKAKAANLSRQLQMRLQYARLKVEHGWQKQTLNEVENLYFHHYRGKASSSNLNSSSTPKPKKNQSRDRVNTGGHEGAGGNVIVADQTQSVMTTTESLPTQDVSASNTTQVAMDIDRPATTSPNASSAEPIAASDLISSTLAPATVEADQLTTPSVVESSTHSPDAPQAQTQLRAPQSPGDSLASSSSLNIPSKPQSEQSTSLTTEKTPMSPSSLPTQAQNSIATKAAPATQTKTPLSTSAFTSASTSLSPTLTTGSAGKSTITRSPSKLPIPRLPASSYPYASTPSSTSPGKNRKGTSANSNPGTSKSLTSSLPSTTTTSPLLSPYKSSYSSSYPLSLSSTSTTLQSTPSLAGNSGNGTSGLPLTYDSFWSSHSSSSSLPVSYRSNLNLNFSYTSASASAFPTIPPTLTASPGTSAPSSNSATTLLSTTPSSSTASSSNFPFTSSLTSIHNSNTSSTSPLSHSPMVSSLLRSPGLPLFQQPAHPPPVIGGANQNTQLG